MTSTTGNVDYSFGDWYAVGSDPAGTGAVLTFTAEGGTSSFTYYAVNVTADCDAEYSWTNALSYSLDLAAGDTVYFQAYDPYGYVESFDGTVSPLVITAVVTENPSEDDVLGCPVEEACNYDPLATYDDGSCIIPQEGFDCDGNCITGTSYSISVEEVSTSGFSYSLVNYGGEWSLVDLSTGLDVDGINTDNDDASACIPDGCYEISGFSGSGSFYAFQYSLNGGNFVIPGDYGATGTDVITIGDASCIVGCMDETALNYEPLAIAEGECIYPLPGCTDETAVNYNQDAT